MKRLFDPGEPEWMDRPQPVSKELEKDLENLRNLNRHFGSHNLIKHFLNKWMQPGQSYTILDVATGSGDIPRFIVDWAKKRNISVSIDAIDFHPSTLAIAKNLSHGYPEIAFHQSDARSFSSTEKYDIVLCSLALHHFSEEDAVELLRKFASLSRKNVLVSDLTRSWITLASVYLVTTFLYRDPMTKYDGRVSARRAFSGKELRDLAGAAGWQHCQHRLFFPARQAIWLEYR